MKPPPLADAVGARMQGIRCEIDRDLEDLAASARNMVDWKHYVKAHPWLSLGTAVALGFLIVPKRSTVIHSDLATLTELARTGHLAVTPVPTAARGLADRLLAAAANAAVRMATAYLGQSAGSLLGITGQRQTGRHDSNGTP